MQRKEQKQRGRPKRTKSITKKLGPVKKRSRKQEIPDEIDEEFEVDAIRDHRIKLKENKIEFLVHWSNYDETANTWEEFNFFTQDQPEMVEEYLLKFFGSDG